MAIKLSDLCIDNASLGDVLLFAGVTENYEYVNGSKGRMLGYKYDVILPKHNMEKLTVKIDNNFEKFDGEQLSRVEFDELIVTASAFQGKVNYHATATAIKLAEANTHGKDSNAKG